jgi:hypothetical protein
MASTSANTPETMFPSFAKSRRNQRAKYNALQAIYVHFSPASSAPQKMGRRLQCQSARPSNVWIGLVVRGTGLRDTGAVGNAASERPSLARSPVDGQSQARAVATKIPTAVNAKPCEITKRNRSDASAPSSILSTSSRALYDTA